MAHTDLGATVQTSVQITSHIQLIDDYMIVWFDGENRPSSSAPSFDETPSLFDSLTPHPLRHDFLWRNTCYEVFIAADNQPDTPYMELNFSPDGRFNLYWFDGYRTPDISPPRALTSPIFESATHFNALRWHNNHALFWQTPSLTLRSRLSDLLAESAFNPTMLALCFDLAAIRATLTVTDNCLHMQPCMVLNLAERDMPPQLTYWAHRHAAPPDFHDKRHWLAVCSLTQ